MYHQERGCQCTLAPPGRGIVHDSQRHSVRYWYCMCVLTLRIIGNNFVLYPAPVQQGSCSVKSAIILVTDVANRDIYHFI